LLGLLRSVSTRPIVTMYSLLPRAAVAVAVADVVAVERSSNTFWIAFGKDPSSIA